MNGVEILSQEIIYNTILPGYVLGIGFVTIIILAAFLGLCLGYEKWIATIIVSILLIPSMIVITLSSISDKTDINHIEYKVTIDDSVSMNEFLDKYEILDQEGKIYTVKERE